MNYLQKKFLKLFIVKSSGLGTDFRELKDPLAFLDSIKNMKYR